jgi:hypothetical protein
MSAASNYLENEILDHILGEGARDYTPATNLHIALFSGTASTVLAALESGTSGQGAANWGEYEITSYGTDSSASNYTRTAVNFNTASGGSATNSGNVTFPTAGSNYTNSAGSGSTVTCIAVMDASTAGNVLFYGQLDNPKEILNGDTFQISDTNLQISLA